MTHTRKVTITAGLVALAAVIALTACGPTAQTRDTPPPAGPTETTQLLPSELPSETAIPEEEMETESVETVEEVEEDPLHEFGDTVDYDSGLQVTVGKVKAFKYSYPEELEKGQRAIRFTVTVKNNSSTRWDPSMFSTTASTGNDEAEQIFDFDNDLEGAPSTKLLKGKTRTWDMGYVVNKGEDFVLEVSPDWETEAAIFVS